MKGGGEEEEKRVTKITVKYTKQRNDTTNARKPPALALFARTL